MRGKAVAQGMNSYIRIYFRLLLCSAKNGLHTSVCCTASDIVLQILNHLIHKYCDNCEDIQKPLQIEVYSDPFLLSYSVNPTRKSEACPYFSKRASFNPSRTQSRRSIKGWNAPLIGVLWTCGPSL